ncbi:MAG: carbon monoxide dehydrogenase subunit G [Thermaerobacter sp.]|nr:carbon monoxide dehydrogenase subunit G [Thermaerobacter sp.]
MHIEGNAALSSPREAVFAALEDPQALQRSLPGCKELRAEEDGFYARFVVGVAAVRGEYEGSIHVRRSEAPSHYDFALAMEGQSGFLEAQVETVLMPQGDGTNMHYAAEAEMGGMLASMGQRVAGGVATMLVRQFCEALDREAKGR